MTNNLFIGNPIAMSYGYVNGAEKAGGVSGEISGNVIYGSRDISGSPRGWGLEIGNTRPVANGGGTVVKNNIYAGYAANGQPAIQLSLGTNVVNPEQGVGINDLTLQNNIVYGWTQGISINGALSRRITGRNALNNSRSSTTTSSRRPRPRSSRTATASTSPRKPGRTTATTRWPPIPPGRPTSASPART